MGEDRPRVRQRQGGDAGRAGGTLLVNRVSKPSSRAVPTQVVQPRSHAQERRNHEDRADRPATNQDQEENGFAERLMWTIREEEIDLSEYRDFAAAYGQLGRFLDDVDNRKRIHSSPGYLTPAASERQWLRGQKAMALP
jgi:hypothetical protein